MCGDQPLLDSDDEMASEASARKPCIADLEQAAKDDIVASMPDLSQFVDKIRQEVTDNQHLWLEFIHDFLKQCDESIIDSKLDRMEERQQAKDADTCEQFEATAGDKW